MHLRELKHLLKITIAVMLHSPVAPSIQMSQSDSLIGWI